MSAATVALWTGRIFPGLRPFEEADALLFFGRERQIDDLLRRLDDTRFLGVVGLSGSGKSSLVRAGLLPALRRGHLANAGSRWHIAVMRPGSDPLGALARALNGALEERDDRRAMLSTSRLGLADTSRNGREPDENLLVVVDQFEELFRFEREYHDRREEAAEFVRLLISAAQEYEPEFRLYIVITMRSDYLGECARFDGLPEVLNESQYLVPSMTSEQLREAIDGPAALGGVALERELSETLLERVEGELDQLPVLQHLLMRMWEIRDQTANGVSVKARQYELAGGWDGALDRHAEEVLKQIGPAREPLVKRIFQRLTEKGVLHRESRRPATLKDLAAVAEVPEEEVKEVLKPFRAEGCNFLNSPDAELTSESVIDISHESLIRRWTKLKVWVEEEADSAEWYRRVETGKRLKDCGEGGWFSDRLQLAAAVRARADGRWNRPWAERYATEVEGKKLPYEQVVGYLDESKKKDELRGLRMKWAITAVLAVVFAAVAAAALVNWSQAHEARQETLALLLALDSDSVRNSQIDVTLPALLAAESVRQQQTAQGYTALWKVNNLMLRAAGGLRHGDAVTSMAFSADGKLAATGSADGIARLWDVASSRTVAELKHGAAVNAVAFSADGRLVATASSDNTARVWEVANGRGLKLLRHAGWVNAVAFSPDGKWLLTGSSDSLARIWEVPTGREWMRFPHPHWVNAVAYSPDGRLLATGCRDGVARVWVARTGRELRRLLHQKPVNSVAFSPDGVLLATGSRDGTARVWDARSGRETFRENVGEPVNAVAFSPDGTTLATGSQDKTVRMFETRDGRELNVMATDGAVTSIAFQGPEGAVLGTAAEDKMALLWEAVSPHASRLAYPDSGDTLASSPDGTRFAAVGPDGSVRVWETQTGRDLARFFHPARIAAIVFNGDGSLVATGAWDGAAQVWDVQTGRVVRRFNHSQGVNAVALSPDGTLLATAAFGKTARVWDVRTGRVVRHLEHGDTVFAVAFSPDGRLVATGSLDSTARVWEARSGNQYGTLKHGGPVHAVAFSPNGEYLATGSSDNTARVWAMGTGRLAAVLEHDGAINLLAFSPDSRFLATGSTDNAARVWEVKTGRKFAELSFTKAPVHIRLTAQRTLQIETVVGESELFLNRDPVFGEELIQEACSKLGRNFTDAEWKQYAPRTIARPRTCAEHQLNQFLAARQ